MANPVSLLLVSLFAPIALSTSFVATTTSPVPAATVTTSQDDFPALCFDCGPGVGRLDAGTAANAACHHWYNTIMYPPPSGTSGGLGYVYVWSGGNIYLSVIRFWMSMGGGSTVTYNDFFVDEKRCYYAFMTPIDSCDTGGVNGKQGGFWYDWCANVTINPNPDGCYNSNTDVASTHDHLLNSGIQVVKHYTTDEEHEAAKASLLQREQALHHDASADRGVGSIPDPSAENDADINARSAAGDPSHALQKRDPAMIW